MEKIKTALLLAIFLAIIAYGTNYFVYDFFSTFYLVGHCSNKQITYGGLTRGYSLSEVTERAARLGYRQINSDNSPYYIDLELHDDRHVAFMVIKAPNADHPNNWTIDADFDGCTTPNYTLTKNYKAVLQDLGIENEWVSASKIRTVGTLF